MPMNAILANLPLPSSADKMLVFSLGSLEVRTLKPKPNSFPYARSGMHCLEYIGLLPLLAFFTSTDEAQALALA